MKIRHLDLFSGAVSGFCLAASWVWPEHELVALCEIDPWRRKQLNRLWPGVPVIEDVNDEEQIAAYASGERELQVPVRSGKSRKTKAVSNGGNLGIDLLTASPPCQPSSCAGLRLGKADPRWLWPQTIRAVEIAKPRWVICENPPGFLSIDGGLAFESVVAGLEGAGYWVENFIVPASAVGAWHRRDRLWIIAHDDRDGHDRTERDAPESGGNEPEDGLSFRTYAHDESAPYWGYHGEEGRGQEPKSGSGVEPGIATHDEKQSERAGLCESEPGRKRGRRSSDGDCAPSDSLRHSGRADKPQRGAEGRTVTSGDNQGVDADTDIQGPQIREMQSGDFRQEFAATLGDPWNMHWLQAVRELCPVVHGLPFSDLTPDKAKWISAMGDSVVPQVAARIMEAIKDAMEGK